MSAGLLDRGGVVENDTRRGGILVSRKTLGNEHCFNFSTMGTSSVANGGPSNMVIMLFVEESPV